MQDQREYVANFQRALSDARFNAYRRPSDTSHLDVIARYLWNTALSEALYPALQALEITLRNSVHEAISQRAGSAMWFEQQPPLLRPSEWEKVTAAKRELQQDRKPLEGGRIVAELSFGFWTSLFDSRYERVLWPALLKPTFPNMPRHIRTRLQLSKRLNQIRRLRNRVFHHESILNWLNPGLQPQHAQILEIITWINPAMAHTVAFIDRFTTVYVDGTTPYRARVEQYLGA